MILGFLVACGGGPPADPRAEIAAAIAPSAPGGDPRTFLRSGQIPAACNALRSRVGSADEEDWRMLLVGAARAGGKGCLSPEQADALARWAADRPGWRGARAEWSAAAGRLDEAAALLVEPGEDAARLRVELARGDLDLARDAAEGALIADPGDVLACRIVAQAALDRNDLEWAIESAECDGNGDTAADLLRIRAAAIDRAGTFSTAESLYERAGATVHQAAILYQENPTPERVAKATRLLSGDPTPPAALHRAWMAILHLTEGPPSPDGLDGSVPATLARAMMGLPPADPAAFDALPGSAAAIVRARLAARRGDPKATERELAQAIAADPAREAVHRARVALRLQIHGDVAGALFDWAAQDPDHVLVVGSSRTSRDIPWAALVPETWEELAAHHPDPRMRADAPMGADAVGARLREAMSLTGNARADALAALAHDVSGLDALGMKR